MVKPLVPRSPLDQLAILLVGVTLMIMALGMRIIQMQPPAVLTGECLCQVVTHIRPVPLTD